MNREDIPCLWLACASFLSPEKRNALLSVAESVEALYTDYQHYFTQVAAIIGEDRAMRLATGRKAEILEPIIRKLTAIGGCFIPYYKKDYPKQLLLTEDYPIGLFAKGDISLLNSTSIAVVGTRKLSKYGESVTEALVRELAVSGLTIVSGLALGVDSIAHTSAIDVGGRTIGVIASGLDIIYPPENRNLYEMLFKDNLVISEYPLGVQCQKYRFVERNRIVSGISHGVLVTEAGERSGSLVTLNIALDQGKNVYVVPGNIFSKTSKGTNAALKDLRTALVTQASDILADFPSLTESKKTVSDIQLTVLQASVLTVLEKGETHFEDLIGMTQLSVPELMSILMEMELLGLVKRLDGNYYSL